MLQARDLSFFCLKRLKARGCASLDPMKDWVEAQARTGRISNASDYVRHLIRRDQMRNDKIAAMQSFVDAGLQSGVGIRSKEELFAEAMARASKS
ncbi:LOW QUALITY PROTEIN: hypothetical protein Rleg4DRAFT_5119 [Rhizobium leguminosarum bv. trifolii WSM2297]|uniref:Uncharacterized protein n=1 Tax=Rhizobium leguminosarum bv. trifolii WSM2297 TaxID=754762 RepID=J0KZT7_RHILT|nr:LOW QUALITY PROTEIN: hypothetical protein Rleg4DRAFT_5119 [Rhizobium leguminosarum bv. trifolii WSM2297]